jgi:curved DNA-binding protein CbpA
MTCTSDEAKDYFYLIDKAWKTLSDSKTRIEYDAILRGMLIGKLVVCVHLDLYLISL